MNSAKRRASSPLLIIGAITAAAPASVTRLAAAKSPTPTRTTEGLPASATDRIARAAPTRSSAPCCMSSVTASKSSRASASATCASLIPIQAL